MAGRKSYRVRVRKERKPIFAKRYQGKQLKNGGVYNPTRSATAEYGVRGNKYYYKG